MSNKPFFANFLEKQIDHPEQLEGGESPTSVLTDAPTSVLSDAPTDRKRDSITSSSRDNVTQKYPSDSDEGVPM